MWDNSGKQISKGFKFKNFAQSLDFVNKIGKVAERLNHHPDIAFGWGYANITITTHESGGLTEADFQLAKEIDKL